MATKAPMKSAHLRLLTAERQRCGGFMIGVLAGSCLMATKEETGDSLFQEHLVKEYKNQKTAAFFAPWRRCMKIITVNQK